MKRIYIIRSITISIYNLGYSSQFTGKVIDSKTGMPIVEANISFDKFKVKVNS